MEEKSIWRDKFKQHKVCVLIPTYNNATTLKTVISEVLTFTESILVVNDGSLDNTQQIINSFTTIKQVSYSQNRGKGWALRKGFEYALTLGYDYAITIDSDGQHFASDLPHFIEKLEIDGAALIIGARNMNQAAVPGKSSFGGKFSNFWFYVETGIKAPDTQSGYRLYPIRLLEKTKWFTYKYEFEIEIIVRAAWRGIKIDFVPVTVFYAPKEVRISHFRPFKDFSRISVLNTVLVILTFGYILPKKFLTNLFKKETYVELWESIIGREETTFKKSAAIGFGIFMGIIPLWGFQMVAALFLATLFRLNKLVVIAFANISIPPMIPAIIYTSYKIGGWCLGHDYAHLLYSNDISVESIHLNFMQYLAGSIVFAFVSGFAFFVLSFLLISVFRRK